jgi:hypothetical protein
MVTAGLDSLDLFEPMLAIRKLLRKLKFCIYINTDFGEVYISEVLSRRSESQASILGWRFTLIAAEEKSQSHYIW